MDKKEGNKCSHHWVESWAFVFDWVRIGFETEAEDKNAAFSVIQRDA